MRDGNLIPEVAKMEKREKRRKATASLNFIFILPITYTRMKKKSHSNFPLEFSPKEKQKGRNK